MPIDTGSTGFMLIATALVMFMTPGLAFFYGGLVGRKNVLTIMFQSFISLGVTTIIWFLVGYSMCFSGSLGQGDIGGIIGNFDMAFFRGVDLMGPSPMNPKVPLMVFVAYQMMFAIITPALITGAFANRVRFPAYLLFLVAWLLLVYFPLVHMVWGGGLLAAWGVKDFAGGIVVHTSAGFAAFASVLFVGKRKVHRQGTPQPAPRGPGHSHPLVRLVRLQRRLGVRRGPHQRPLPSSTPTWRLPSRGRPGSSSTGSSRASPSSSGFLTGSVAGLATITPCAGFVSTPSAVIIGVIASCACYLAVNVKNKAGLDDALDVFGVHGVGGFLGTILLGVFGTAAMTLPGRDPSLLASGLVDGSASLLVKQSLAALGTALYAFLFTLAMLWLINKVTKVRVSEKEELAGLDMIEHGEEAYI